MDTGIQQKKSEETPPPGSSLSLSSIILRLVGIIAIMHSVIGLLIGFVTLAFIPKYMTPSLFEKPGARAQFEKTIEQKWPDYLETARNFDITQLASIVETREFWLFFYGMAILCVIFNCYMAFLGYRFFRYHFQSIWPFVGLMICYFLYSHVFPRFITESELGMTFASAWGIGNAGSSTILLTYFWIWGPLLTFFAGRHFLWSKSLS